MKTPAGKECHYFFGDYHRGKDVEACRLIESNPESPAWQPSDCQVCPVPDILHQNSCPNMVLDAVIVKGFLGLGRKVEVKGWCSEYFLDVKEPAIGCGHCHEFRGPSILDLDTPED